MASEPVQETVTDLSGVLPGRGYVPIFMAIASMLALRKLHDAGRQEEAIAVLQAEFATLERNVIDKGLKCPRCMREASEDDKAHWKASAVVLNNYFFDKGDFRKMHTEAEEKLLQAIMPEHRQRVQQLCEEVADTMIRGVHVVIKGRA